MRAGRIPRAARWLGLGVLCASWLVIAGPAGSQDAPPVPTGEDGEPLFVTSCEGGEVQDIPDGAAVTAAGPLYPPELSARISEALESTTVELRTVEDLAKLDLPPDVPWVETLREELAALAPGDEPIQMTDLRKDPWPELRREMAEIFDRYYDWCVRELPNGDIERQLLVKTWPLPWLS